MRSVNDSYWEAMATQPDAEGMPRISSVYYRDFVPVPIPEGGIPPAEPAEPAEPPEPPPDTTPETWPAYVLGGAALAAVAAVLVLGRRRRS